MSECRCSKPARAYYITTESVLCSYAVCKLHITEIQVYTVYKYIHCIQVYTEKMYTLRLLNSMCTTRRHNNMQQQFVQYSGWKERTCHDHLDWFLLPDRNRDEGPIQLPSSWVPPVEHTPCHLSDATSKGMPLEIKSMRTRCLLSWTQSPTI